jgi:hypothetical protein
MPRGCWFAMPERHVAYRSGMRGFFMASFWLRCEFSLAFRPSGQTSLWSARSGEQSLFDDHQIGQREQRI